MTLTPYRGIGDPKVHIIKFESMMFLNSDSDPILCRSFPTFLDGTALLWFSNLPAGSISSFDEFAKLFINHFSASKIYVRDSDYLSTIKQGQHESLKDYMTRFTIAAMKIPDLNPEVQLHAIKSGLWPGKFQEVIAVAKLKTLEEFREKVTGQIEVEELREARKVERSARTYQDQKYVDESKHCAFHQKFGHITDECVVAKDLLERLARQNLLDKYVTSRGQKEAAGDLDKPRYNSESKDKDPWHGHVEVPTFKRVINHISGGFVGGGATSTTRKRSYRAMMTMNRSHPSSSTPFSASQITFSASDLRTSYPNMDDPVVISVDIGELTVKKVLLVSGSSADVLFYSTFKKMQLSDKSLQPSPRELVGFSGERVPVSSYV
ncbi:uncharacterized protein LOC107646254 [Arachis ipaensis]|uniref:uncharacterized protein LOC107646254 n=1 Tax=Arachis ipaensis TaxID=130454 RepID=UPI0007AFA57C|nr:uncharacterized protein LOC107646254 [Arachis ipaensis]